VVGDLLQPTHLLFVLVVALLVLGPKRLPEVGRALGRGLRDFRSAISGEDHPEQTIPAGENSTATPAPPPPAAQEEPTEVVGAGRTAEFDHTAGADRSAEADHTAEPSQTAPASQPDQPVEAVSSSTRTDASA
jgi:sec-independent protein translocase protein TatA